MPAPATDTRSAPPPDERAPQAVRDALRLFARRSRTEAELRTALSRHHQPHDVGLAVERMRALGYVDDVARAAEYIARPRARQRSAALLRRELTQRGIAPAAAEQALASHDDGEAAARAARARIPALRRLDSPRRARRLHDHLRRRGFDAETATRTATLLLGGDVL